MALLNHAKKELSAKIVYYGPGLSGKTTNLEWIHRKLAPDKRGKLISLETKTDRTLFFDFLPVQIGEINGFRTRFNVYTVPGQIFYNETRRMVLKGVDGIVFVADSQKEMANENIENLKNLAENLRSIGKELSKVPLVFQFNKRDLPNILSVEEMNRLLNAPGLPYFEAVAVKGEGVLTTLTRITRVVADHLKQTLFSSRPPEPRPAGSEPSPPQPDRPEPVPAQTDLHPERPRFEAPAFLDGPSEQRQFEEPTRPQVLSEDSTITTDLHNDFSEGSVQAIHGHQAPPLGALGTEPSDTKEIPSLGDVEPPQEVRSSQIPRPPAQAETAVPLEHAPPKEPEQTPPPSNYWMDPSLVTVGARDLSMKEGSQTEPAPSGMRKGVALRFGEPERESGTQVRIPVALRIEGSNEIISFQMVIRVEPQPRNS